MFVGVKVKQLKLESINPTNWKNTILVWEEDMEDLVSDPDYTHVSWEVDGVVEKIITARRVINAPNVKRFSRTHNKEFFVINKKDLVNESF